ncbi:MAG: LysM peptidoglycan-binding domain-containing protein [Candidatus Omnitrophota bacterium]
MNRFKLAGIFVLTSTLALSGCVARTYNLTRDRVDQDLTPTSGNRGYFIGTAPEPKERTQTRTTRVFEVELGIAKKSAAICPATTPLAANSNMAEEPVVTENQEEAPIESTSGSTSFEKYTVSKNDTLQKISKKFFGTTKKWYKIYQANKDTLRGPDKLYPGQILNIPSEGGLKVEAEKLEEPKENLK